VISYSVYLWHEPLTALLLRHGLTRGDAVGVPLNMLIVFAVSCAAATLTYRFVEAPAMRLHARLAPGRGSGRPAAPEPADAQAAP
jgi:peptidoglycan/LPS O-acetylase OafA/YrhL